MLDKINFVFSRERAEKVSRPDFTTDSRIRKTNKNVSAFIRDRETGRIAFEPAAITWKTSFKLAEHIKDQRVLDKDIVAAFVATSHDVINIEVINELMNRFPMIAKEIFYMAKKHGIINLVTYANTMKNIESKGYAINIETIKKINVEAHEFMQRYLFSSSNEWNKWANTTLFAAYIYGIGNDWAELKTAQEIYQQAKQKGWFGCDTCNSMIRAAGVYDWSDITSSDDEEDISNRNMRYSLLLKMPKKPGGFL